MTELKFEVYGSKSEPYYVVAQKHGDGTVSVTCTCPAGEMRTYCKHRFALLNGDVSSAPDAKADDVNTLADWVKSSKLQDAMNEVQLAEAAAQAAKQELSKRKKALARIMNGNR
jgi:NADPH:quinone reductase-like Zn-dependent oxidoreductase